MPDIKRILVPVNGTEESTKALKLADTLAQIYNAEIALLLVTYFNENTDDKANEDSWPCYALLPVLLPNILIMCLTTLVIIFLQIYK